LPQPQLHSVTRFDAPQNVPPEQQAPHWIEPKQPSLSHRRVARLFEFGSHSPYQSHPRGLQTQLPSMQLPAEQLVPLRRGIG
jgi:hypothetical protein